MTKGPSIGPSTNHTSLKLLAKSVLTRLENNKVIVFNVKERAELQEDLFKRLGRFILTEEDLNSQVRAQVAARGEALSEQNIGDSEAFQSQKRAIKSRMGDNQLHGFYFQDTLRAVCQHICKFLFESPIVEDVFESDEVIQKMVMETIQGFNESQVH